MGETAETTEHPVARRVPAVLFEVTLATAAYLAYFLVRGLTETGFDRARRNAERVIDFERWAGLYHEHSIQDALGDSDLLVDVANWVYVWGHWPVIIVVGAVLLHTRADDYRVLRNAFLISGGIGLVVFATFPVAPPRLLDLGLVDTVTERSVAYRVLQPPAFVNQYAAMPSLHFGWDLLIGIVLVRFGGRWYLRAIGVVLPAVMAWAIVATANHFVIDAFAGGALALFGLAVAMWAASPLERFQQRAQSAVARLVGAPGGDSP